ncbi:MAG: T9SS type A sorting domain-containing protein [Chitinophagaceae bacterium]|nr:T9SS type A sorting domain-containing protein [Chitinophagaceae bacterium]
MNHSSFLRDAGMVLLATTLTLCTFITMAQQLNPPILTSQRSLGSSADDQFRSMSLTPDGGCILAGYSTAANGDVAMHLGQKDYWIVKLDSAFAIEWQQVLGGSKIDWARNVQCAADGGYLILGYSNSTNGQITVNQGSYDYWLVKLDQHGNLLWQKTVGGSLEDNGYTVRETVDGGYICAGFSFSADGDITGSHGMDDGWVVKLDAERNIQWQRSMGGTASDEFDDVILTADGGYMLVGYAGSANGDATINYGGFDVWLVKLDENGNTLWEKSYGGSLDDAARKGIQTSDGGFIIAGFSASGNGDATMNNGKLDYWILRVDSIGTLQWQKSLGSSGTDYAYNIVATPDGNFLITGLSGAGDGDVMGNEGGSDAWIIKMDMLGNILWQKNLGGSMEDVARSCAQLPDGSVIVVGFTMSGDGDVTGQHGGYDGWVAKLCFTSDFYFDGDQDGFGNALLHVSACSAPQGYVSNNADCNDSNSSIYPDAIDFCDGMDNNCDGQTDENTINPVIEAGGATEFCLPGSVVLSVVNAGSENQYKWYKDGLLMKGQTDASISVKTSGSYYAKIKNSGCTIATNSITIQANPLPEVAISPEGTIAVCRVATTLAATESENYNYQWYNNNSIKEGAINAIYLTDNAEAGDYKVQVSDDHGCSTFSPVTTIVRLNNPVSKITPATSLNLCNTGAVALQASNGNGFTHQWYKDAMHIAGATDESYTATSIGDFTVEVTNENGCSKISNPVAVFSACRESPEDYSCGLNFSMYPNPVSDILNVTIIAKKPGEVNLILYNVFGQALHSMHMNAAANSIYLEIPLSNYIEEGIYYLSLTSGNEKVVKSFHFFR